MRELRSSAPMPPLRRVRLALRILRTYAAVRRRLAREPLPNLAARFGDVAPHPGDRIPPRQLAWAIDRTLRVGSHRPRCIFNALVMYRLLREQGDPAVLVIGLPKEAMTKDAHAWVEIDGTDVGPPPGRAGHEEMARFS
ncbi:MAG TPA: lasso peptide biosynthesis B2 protein [Gaiellales bacterium]|nr:lasso peptide biosynthesis B2 protein [Gaiellales bacterium]